MIRTVRYLKHYYMNYFTSLFLLFGILMSCNNTATTTGVSDKKQPRKQYKKIGEMQWLLGTWVNKTEDDYSEEKWERKNDSTFFAFSYTKVGKDTVFAENVLLQQNGERLEMMIVAFNQNENQPVSFGLISSEENKFIFENKKHDFPQRIVYTNPVKDSLHAWIEGQVEGERRVVDFNFKKN